MDLRSMLNEPSQRPPQTQQQQQQQQQLQQQHHHHHQQPQLQPLQPPPPSAQHHRPHQPPPLQPPQPQQQYQSPVYPPRQQQQFPLAQSPHHAPSPANQYPYAPPSPHGGPPVGQHHYPYPHPQGQPAPYGPAPSGAQGHQPHPQYQQLQHHQQHQQQQQQPHQQQQQQPNHHQVNSNAGSPLQPQFYPPQSPHQQQQFSSHYPRHAPASPSRGPPRPPLLQTGPNDRAPQHTISTPTSATRNPRGGDREIRQIERDRSISPKTRVYPEDPDRDADSIMRDDVSAGYQGNTGPHQGGGPNNVQNTRPNPHHRSQSQGIPHSAIRANSHVNQQGQPGNQLQRNMEVDTEHDGRMWSNTAPVTPVDRKGVNGFEHGPTNHNPHAREISSQAHSHQTQNAPIPNSTNNNAPSAVHPPTLSHPPPPPPPPPHQQHPQQQQQQQQHQQQHQQIQQMQHQHQQHQSQPQPPPPQQQQHIQPVPSNNTQRPVTSSPSTKEQLYPPSHHRSTPSNSSQFPNRPPQPPSPKSQRDRELLPPPAPPAMGGPPRKRPRHEEPPIFARKASRSTSNSPVMPTRRNPPVQPILQHEQLPQQQVKQEQQSQQSVPPQQPPLQPHPSQKTQVIPIKRENAGVVPIKRENTVPPNVPQSPALASHHRPSYPNEHPTLGPWEPSITNTIPYEELTRKITDFLFYNVVKNEDPCLDWTGSGGPILEIEAKLGHLVHKQTQQRLSLPIVTEAVIADGYRDVAFRSTMTEAQHKSFNRFLNDRFAECQPKPQKLPSQGRSPSPSGTSSPTNAIVPPKHPTRVPMKYRHTKERDTFHEVPAQEMQALPPLVMKLLGNGNKKPKIRLTTDDSGRVINKIIKCRVADLNVFSPGTAFDWRVSVNLEMPYTGEVDEKGGGIGGGKGDGRGGGGERNKDRMSYECLEGKFTIDLTQVTSTFETSKKEHELEIEMDSLILKKHGTLAARNKENGFQEYVKGFVDNVRVLCKVVPPNY